MIRSFITAKDAALKFRKRAERKLVEALAGDGAGNVYDSSRPDYVWVRLFGDADQVTVARVESWVGLYENDPVILEENVSGYSLIGFSLAATFDQQYTDSDQYQSTRLVPHGRQHERDDKGAGGQDPVNVYPRMFVPLRAVAQDTPDLTLQMQRGVNPLTGTWLDETTSPAFVPPAPVPLVNSARIDLLYLGVDDALHILQGTATTDGSAPGYPAIPNPSAPLAYVYLLASTAALTESNIQRDPRLTVGALGSHSPHDLLDGYQDRDTAAHTGVLGDLIAFFGGVWDAISGNTTTTRKFLRQVGTGAASAAPAWDTLQAGDLPDTAVTPATYGDSTHVGAFTVDAQGRITGASDVAISGASLEIKETDGAPDVVGVVEITVPNGTLTDDGGGAVTLNIGGATDPVQNQPGNGAVIISGLAGSPDINAGGLDDLEFDATLTGVTTLGSLDTLDANGDFKSRLHMAKNSSASQVDGIYWACPSMPFTMECKIDDLRIVENNQQAGLFVAEASPGKLETFSILFDSPMQYFQHREWTDRTTSAGASSAGSGTYTTYAPPIYLRAVVHSSTNVDYYFSFGGFIYYLLFSGVNPGFTIGAVGLFVNSLQGGVKAEAVFDWVRFS